MTYKFTSNDGSRKVVVQVDNHDMTWMDLSEEFFEFLRGCGFYLDRQDLSDYFKSDDEQIVISSVDDLSSTSEDWFEVVAKSDPEYTVPDELLNFPANPPKE